MTCTTDGSDVRIGLGYVSGVRSDEVAALVAARAAGGPFRSLGDLASRAGAGRPALAQLAWAGACDSLRGGTASRREILWELGVAAPGEPVQDGTQLSLPLDVPGAPELRELEPWEAMIADYATTGLTLGPTRWRCCARSCPPARCPAATSRRSGTTRGCGSAASSSRASAPGRPRASSSCCSRTSSGPST